VKQPGDGKRRNPTCQQTITRDTLDRELEHLQTELQLRIDSVILTAGQEVIRLNERLEVLNGHHAAMEKQSELHVHRNELALLTREIKALQQVMAENKGKASMSHVAMAWLIAGAGLLLSLWSVLK